MLSCSWCIPRNKGKGDGFASSGENSIGDQMYAELSCMYVLGRSRDQVFCKFGRDHRLPINARSHLDQYRCGSNQGWPALEHRETQNISVPQQTCRHPNAFGDSVDKHNFQCLVE